MRFQPFDVRFPSLTFYCLCFYWLVCLVTLGITIGSVVQQVGVYRADCSLTPSDYDYDYYYGDVPSNVTYYDNIPVNPGCIAGDIAVFALGLVVAVLGIIQSSSQLILFYRHQLSPRQLCFFNFVLMVLWIVVIAIGWDPTNWSYDYDTGTATPNIAGWLYTYSSYWESESVSYGISATLALAMGFAVMSIISFGLSTLLAIYAFIVHHRNSRRKNSSVEEALMTAPTLTEKKITTSAPSPESVTILQGTQTSPLGPVDTDAIQFRPQEVVTSTPNLTEKRTSASAPPPENVTVLEGDRELPSGSANNATVQPTPEETVTTTVPP